MRQVKKKSVFWDGWGILLSFKSENSIFQTKVFHFNFIYFLKYVLK